MLTDGKQIAAARQLLGWSQADLAEKAGISKPSIIRMEKDLFSVKHDAQTSVQTAIESNGIEFLDGNGLRENTNTVKKYSGQKGFQDFYDDLYETARDIGGDICLFNGISELVEKWLGTEFLKMHKHRMLKIKDNFQFRVVVKDGDNSFLGSDYCSYRWFPENLFNDKTIFMYGTKVAFLTFEENSLEIIVLNQRELAESQILFFNLAWNYVAIDTRRND